MTKMEEGEIKFVQVKDVMIKLILPFILVLGTLLNIVSMIITSKKMALSSFMMLVFTLNILDTVGLFTEPFWMLINHWLNNGATQSLLACQIVLYMYNFVITCTSWITVYICFDQAAKLCFQNNRLITHKKGIILIVITVAASSVSNLHFFLSEQHFIQEVSMSSMSCSIQSWHVENVSQKETDLDKVRYSFNWKWLNKLMSCFFPVTLTLACLIAIWQGMKTVSQNEMSVTQMVRPRMSLKERENVKITCAAGIMLILSIVPLAFFKTQASDMNVAEMQLMCSVLSFLVYINFSMKLVYFCALSTYFRRNVFNIFKTGVIAWPIRKLSTFQNHRAMELLSVETNEARLYFEDTCSDTESHMSTSPVEHSDTLAFSFTDTCDDTKTGENKEKGENKGTGENVDRLDNVETEDRAEHVENIETLANVESSETEETDLKVVETVETHDTDC